MKADYPLIPLPKRIRAHSGHFVVDARTTIALAETLADCDTDTALLLQAEINAVLSVLPQVTKAAENAGLSRENRIWLRVEPRADGPESYRLAVTETGVTIAAGGSAGLLYGTATLVQLFRLQRAALGCVEISDAPDFANRGYMLDVSRGRVPKMETLKRLVDRLALYKINQLQLYMETSFCFEGLEEVWSQTDPLTPENLLELDRYCAGRSIELVPCLATFGHLYDLLRAESFRPFCELDETAGEPFTWYHRMRYHVLNVLEPGSFTLVCGLLEQYLPLFRSRRVNICCDETFDLGKGKSAEEARREGAGKLYLTFVNRLAEWLQGKGYSVMLWADILLNHTESLGQLNPDVTCLNWHYYYDADAERVKLLADGGFAQYVCPSPSGYSRLVNEYDMSFANIREMARLGAAYGAVGLLNADWGDTGNINMPALGLPGMIYGAGLSWNTGDGRPDEEIDRAVSQLEYGDASQTLVGLLRRLARQDIVIFNDFVFFRDFKIYGLDYQQDGGLYQAAAKRMMAAGEEQLKDAMARCGEILRELKLLRAEQKQLLPELYLSATGVALMQEVALVLKKREYGQAVCPPRPAGALAAELEHWMMDYCTAWRATSR